MTVSPSTPLTLGDSVTIAPDVAMPSVGFGVFQIPPDDTERAVTAALAAGYRHIDAASIYGNEHGVGAALAASDLPRNEVFVTTKLWNTDQPSDRVRPALERSLELLGLDHVDLYLIHWPAPALDQYVTAWDGLLELARDGLTRAVGVSNFTTAHVDRIISTSGVAPAVNQVELHPLLTQDALLAHHRDLGVATTAWSPLAKAEAVTLPPVVAVAERIGRTAAQVVLRWHLQRGTIVIPKSVDPGRMASNLDLFDFELSDDDMAALTACDAGYRTGPDPDTFAG